MNASSAARVIGLDQLARSLEQLLARASLAAAPHEASPAAFAPAELAVRMAVRTRRTALNRAARGGRLRLRLAPAAGRWETIAAALRRRLPGHDAAIAGQLEIRVRVGGAALVLINGRRLNVGKAEES